ncbi:hemerythrin HHE cation binding domain protein [Capnocytophaga sp. oral taxon 863 str. F0517]|uniref:hemerythrin domain-containing protein n=1 Tax=Capnocytophaga sp. oral taxon 863 TaxID=1227265 RepID=UPI000397C523|nr:hemerythrin domain-containing protein [Capnocytophaga sp. oral taxon 863]ERI63113.1 hemerythrin HHE cation binding domain protein [Capnocytophaga sp. oral taxon 863 str. F0517]
MKRNENIVLLSRDHHFGLLHIWKIRQGLKKEISAERIAAYISSYWQQNQEAHFLEEEKYLFPYIKHELIDQALREHEQIRQIIAQLAMAPTVKLLEEYAELLNAHIRYEERVLFPYMEENLSDEALQQIGKNLTEEHHTEVEEYADEFWK